MNKVSILATKKFLDKLIETYSDDEFIGCGYNLGAEARQKQRQEQLLKTSLSEITRKEEVTEKSDIVKVTKIA